MDRISLGVSGIVAWFVALGRAPRPRRTLIHHAVIYGLRGIIGGLIAGATVSWLLIRLDGMGNGGDTRIVVYEVRDFVDSSLIGMGICLAAALSLPQRSARA